MTVEPILPECEVDTALVETLVPPVKRYSHQYGCQNVAKRMRENYADDFVVGVIDRDRKAIPYLAKFEVVREVAGDLILWRHPAKHHYLIQVCPAVEKWILNRAAESNINLEECELPATLAELCAVTKTIVSQQDRRLIKLFKKLKASGNPVVNTLIFWLTHLKEHRFQADLEALKKA